MGDIRRCDSRFGRDFGRFVVFGLRSHRGDCFWHRHVLATILCSVSERADIAQAVGRWRKYRFWKLGIERADFAQAGGRWVLR